MSDTTSSLAEEFLRLRREPECACLPGQVCAQCETRGYENGLAGYAARIYPDRVTDADVAAQARADTARLRASD